MDESQLKVPSRIVLPFSSTTSSLSERFSKLRQCALFPHEKHKMAGPRDTRNFLYDDYYEPQQAEEDFGRRPQRGFRSNDLDMELDDYMGRERMGRSYGGRDSGGDRGREFGGRRLDYEQSPPQRARRFASALGLAGAHQDYDEDFGLPQRARQQPRRQQIVRPVRRVYEDIDQPAPRVVEIVERRVPQRRVQIVRKVPIRQRVVKKIIVQKVQRPKFSPKRPARRGAQQQQQKRIGNPKPKRGAGIQKKKFDNKKPKLSASELDRELDEYMRGNKHPRVSTE
ncbi:hypothetical protein M3Y98_00702200 [Aphelenchoides besseyi]|nr:hypothetical protein M3Y98_00702200 [Aphelenchoides besseyi]KAI6210417.1 hypothetical protein M3Y96_00325900 [Aphelenchoides besseyi]